MQRRTFLKAITGAAIGAGAVGLSNATAGTYGYVKETTRPVCVGGTFTLKVGNKQTRPIPYNATQEEIAWELASAGIDVVLVNAIIVKT